MAQERKTFQKGYKTQWTHELFRITRIERTVPYVYRVEDLHGEPILGTFYEQELQKVKDVGLYRIASILQKRNGYALVNWTGYGKKFNSWIPINNITNYLN